MQQSKRTVHQLSRELDSLLLSPFDCILRPRPTDHMAGTVDEETCATDSKIGGQEQAEFAQQIYFL